MSLKKIASIFQNLKPISQKRMKRLIADIKEDHRRKLKDLEERHEQEIGKTAKHADDLIKQLSRIDLRHVNADDYALQIRIDSRLLSGVYIPEQREFIRQRIAHQVGSDLARLVFVSPKNN